ncbi:hypothetical protein BJY04DRAFT_70667 [Aspergillus karnatakaensis]|uniref:S-adenosylmethionine-dependent methyltransferase n=1 Tax=Aspergillus karnatakaensis TaxID=1810916 RepID=UPI003CCCD78A
MDGLMKFLDVIGEEVEDAEEESFLLFSQSIPSSNLGFVDSKSTTIDLTIHEREYTIHQSPTLLSSSRAGGTTGAVLWKITPLFATWLSNQPTNPLWTHNILTPSSTVVELGCGISALTALTLSPLLSQSGHYLATDQEYVQKLFRQNLDANPPSTSSSKPKSKTRKGGKAARGGKASDASAGGGGLGGALHPNITFTSLDWETDIPDTLKAQISSSSPQLENTGDDAENEEDKGFDVLLSCDCIYNDALISPFVRTCAEIARLRPSYSAFQRESSAPSGSESAARRPTVCIIAQQQRSPEVFEGWLMETMRHFRVWRVRGDVLGRELGEDSGYLVHVLVVK